MIAKIPIWLLYAVIMVGYLILLGTEYLVGRIILGREEWEHLKNKGVKKF